MNAAVAETAQSAQASETGSEVRIEVVRMQGAASPRRGEPVTLGLPLPRGFCSNPAALGLSDPDGRPCAVQAAALDYWPDRSVRWALIDFQADVPASGTAFYRLLPRAPHRAVCRQALTIARCDHGITVDTGRVTLHVARGDALLRVVQPADDGVCAATAGLRVIDGEGRPCRMRLTDVAVEEQGELRTAVVARGRIDGGRRRRSPLELTARFHVFAASPVVRIALTVRNARAARHKGGYWTLGDPGSAYLREVSVVFALPGGDASRVWCSVEPGAPLEEIELPLELYQDSSGGENWRSSNHVNRRGEVPNAVRGYRLRAGVQQRRALRATPLVVFRRGGRQLAVAIRHFWQNFPKAIEATPGALALGLFPGQYSDVHELQGGEQKTHVFEVSFGEDRVSADPLEWCRTPLFARATPKWYCSTGAVPYLLPASKHSDPRYESLVTSAIEGEDSFERKREVIDEYGWRHFGDIYGDHEGAFYDGPAPVVSHYNNQYDAVAGFAYQYMRTGDPHWWSHLCELAAHVVDIDLYHTDRDKSAYNHGLFWHTYHYIDAGASTHRSYPRHSKTAGGGPAPEHNYNTGLMLHYFLTGDAASREAAIGLGQYVVDADDGRQTVFRWIDGGPTGLASASGSPLYHGPGRGSGNSLNALLTAHQLTGDPKFLAKAEELIRRCIHPDDDIAARNLPDVERRWYYTMFLQALGRYLDSKAAWGELDRMYGYGRASLLHYARWMAEHEYPYLDKPEVLEYPTETWAAQDIRKADVLSLAARHAPGEERRRLMERAEFFFKTAVRTLAGMPSRTRARPVVVVLSSGLAHLWAARDSAAAPRPTVDAFDFGTPRPFIPQKLRVKRRLIRLGGLGAAALAALSAWMLE